MELSNRGWYKVFGVVTNRTLAGDELIWWSRQRCDKGEEVHSVLKSDLAGGRLPSGLFGANAAWWAILVLAFNLNSAMKRLVLGGQWVGKRLKAVRFALIALPGRVIRHRSKSGLSSNDWCRRGDSNPSGFCSKSSSYLTLGDNYL